MADVNIEALAAGTVTELKKALPMLDAAQLAGLRAAELAKGEADARTTAIQAIDAALAELDEVGEDAPAGDLSDDAPAGQAGDGPALRPGANIHGIGPDVGGGPNPNYRPSVDDGVSLASGTVGDTVTASGSIEIATADLATLEALMQVEIAGASRAPVIDEIDRRMRMLREEALHRVRGSVAASHAPLARRLDALTAAMGGPTSLAFGDHPRLIEHLSPVEASPGMFTVSGDRVLFQRKLTIAGDVAPADISHVLLLDAEGEVVGNCEIPQGIRAGGGRSIEFPAGSLIF
ncbi:hypothetical protein [Sphingomonas oligoaromativorans]|uniref:hypothetical protein n=1 Tax=Sphingomonas oligoaromativorans TaxID=575322 RepID=UPI001424A175|nr:hypothetical protein [Sphingomonas oligoaromativorans]NIJ34330.1 hypothetical protein [Sphingomonas oligoaromativorans]